MFVHQPYGTFDLTGAEGKFALPVPRGQGTTPISLVNPAPVGFKLGFARTARADSAAQSGHGRAVASQTGQKIIQLRQLDLQLAFAGSRAPREDVENQLGPIENLHVQSFLQITLLRGSKLLIEHDHRRIVKVHLRLELVDFTGTDQGGRIGARAGLDGAIRHARPSSGGQDG